MGGNSNRKFGKLQLSTVVTRPPLNENCYLVEDTASKDLIVVDPGGDATAIINVINRTATKPVAILQTHAHPDHIGAAREIQETYDIPCFVHQDEAATVSQAPAFARALMGFELKIPEHIHYFKDEEPLHLGTFKVDVIDTPGHTPGGVCFVFDGFSLTGDTIFHYGIGRTDFPGGNSRQLADSISRFLNKVPAETSLFSGHGNDWKAHEAKKWWENAF